MTLLKTGASKIRIEFAGRFFRNAIHARLLDIAVVTAGPVASRQVVFRPFRLSRPLFQRQGGESSLIMHAANLVGPAQAFRQSLAQRLNAKGQGQALNASAGNEFCQRAAVRPGGDRALYQRDVGITVQACHCNRPRSGLEADLS